MFELLSLWDYADWLYVDGMFRCLEAHFMYTNTIKYCTCSCFRMSSMIHSQPGSVAFPEQPTAISCHFHEQTCRLCKNRSPFNRNGHWNTLRPGPPSPGRCTCCSRRFACKCTSAMSAGPLVSNVPLHPPDHSGHNTTTFITGCWFVSPCFKIPKICMSNQPEC